MEDSPDREFQARIKNGGIVGIQYNFSIRNVGRPNYNPGINIVDSRS